jgi:DNA-directed RNA polymerase specialized sigma24 family protein
MVARIAVGVLLVELRAAVALARLHGDGGGVVWPLAEWERLWARLTALQQRVVYLHILVGLTHTQVAEQLGITRGSVDGACRRALARIRDALPEGH